METNPSTRIEPHMLDFFMCNGVEYFVSLSLTEPMWQVLRWICHGDRKKPKKKEKKKKNRKKNQKED